MISKYTLHKLNDGFIITSNEEIKEGDEFLDKNIIFTCRNIFENGIEDYKGLLHKVFNCKKIIAQQPQIDFSSISEEKQKEIGWFDVDRLYLTTPIEKKSSYIFFE